MHIASAGLDTQPLSALDADLDQLAQDMNRLHDVAISVTCEDERAAFARLEHSVNWRLNQLAADLAAQDTWRSNNLHA